MRGTASGGGLTKKLSKYTENLLIQVSSYLERITRLQLIQTFIIQWTAKLAVHSTMNYKN